MEQLTKYAQLPMPGLSNCCRSCVVRTSVVPGEPAETVGLDVERHVGARSTDLRANHVRSEHLRREGVAYD